MLPWYSVLIFVLSEHQGGASSRATETGTFGCDEGLETAFGIFAKPEAIRLQRRTLTK